MHKDNTFKEIKSIIQKKLNFDFQNLDTYEIDLFSPILEKLEILIDSFDDFFDFYINSKNNTVTVKKFNKKEVDKISKLINSHDVFGQLECGWIMGRKEVYFYFGGGEDDFSMSYYEMAKVEWVKVNMLFKSTCSFKNKYGKYVGISCDLMEAHKLFFRDFYTAQENWKKEIQSIKGTLERHLNFRIQAKLSLSKNKYLNDLDKDSNGEIDLVANDFNKLLNKSQKRVLEIDKNYIHQFVKVSNFIKTKKQNTQNIFESIRDTSTQEELEDRVNLLKNQIHAYELLVFHSINMIGALVSEDLITFYEIYESFDKLSMFNSNWENDVSEKLTNIGDKLDDLMYSIYNMEQNIISELSHLSYVTQESFEDLNRSVTSQLKEVESSINTNNLLTGIQAYQLYKINRNTKGLRS